MSSNDSSHILQVKVSSTDESLLSASDSVNVELRSSFAISDFSDFWTPEVLGTDEMSLS
jgi:hypothetical protein